MNEVSDARARELVAQAAAWRLASLLLERPRPERNSEIAKLAAEVMDERVSACAGEADLGTEELYHKLFGPGGMVSPREVSYCGYEDPGQLMAELQSFYRAFAYQPRREESVDHLSVEAGFVGYLFMKEAYAEMQGDSESVKVTRDARERFADQHVRRCAQGMADRLNGAPPYLCGVLCWLAEKAQLPAT